MSFLNINFNAVCYVDGPKTNQPRLKQTDLSWSLLGMPTDNFKNFPISLAPGESTMITSTSRPISFNSSTQFIISTTEDTGIMRITTSIGQRVPRSYGDSTTVWATTANASAVTMTATGGTLPDFTTIQPGDFISVQTGFSSLNQGQYTILAVGTNSVSFVNPYAQAESTSGTLSIFSNGPVQVGDILDITSPQFAYPNQGSFPIINVTDTYIDIANPKTFPQTVTGVTSGLVIYPFSYQWTIFAVDGMVQVGFNGDTPGNVVIEPPVKGDIENAPGFLIKRGKTFSVSIKNPTNAPVQGFVLMAE